MRNIISGVLKQYYKIGMCVKLLLIMLIACTWCSGQSIPFDKYTTDTLRLSSFKAKKTVLYKMNTVTFAVDYKDFLVMYTELWKFYRDGQKFLEKAMKKEGKPAPAGSPRWIVLDSMYKVMTSGIKEKDTLFIDHAVFDKVGFGTWNDFFPQLMDKNKCAVFDDQNVQQFMIIRQKGSWYRGPLAAWGGRRYFLVGASTYFIAATDWIS